jgi:hypothetical protein
MDGCDTFPKREKEEMLDAKKNGWKKFNRLMR